MLYLMNIVKLLIALNYAEKYIKQLSNLQQAVGKILRRFQ